MTLRTVTQEKGSSLLETLIALGLLSIFSALSLKAVKESSFAAEIAVKKITRSRMRNDLELALLRGLEAMNTNAALPLIRIHPAGVIQSLQSGETLHVSNNPQLQPRANSQAITLYALKSHAALHISDYFPSHISACGYPLQQEHSGKWLGISPSETFELSGFSQRLGDCLQLALRAEENLLSRATYNPSEDELTAIFELESIHTLYLDSQGCLRRIEFRSKSVKLNQPLNCGAEQVTFQLGAERLAVNIRFPGERQERIELALQLQRSDYRSVLELPLEKSLGGESD